MAKYTLEFKLAVIRSYEQGNGSKIVAQRFEIDHSTVRKWVAAYRRHGVDGIKPLQRWRSYSSEFKESVLLYMQEHQLSSREVATHFNLRTQTVILQWERQYNQGGRAALEPKPKGRKPTMSQSPNRKSVNKGVKPDTQKSQEELMRELVYLRAENAYLKKLDALIREKQARQKKPVSSKD